MPAASSDEFQRLQTVGTDIGVDTILHLEHFLLCEGFISNENGDACLLHRREGAVVILGRTLFDTEWTVREPVEELNIPLFEAARVGFGPSWCA
jgi:hypothetical protein